MLRTRGAGDCTALLHLMSFGVKGMYSWCRQHLQLLMWKIKVWGGMVRVVGSCVWVWMFMGIGPHHWCCCGQRFYCGNIWKVIKKKFAFICRGVDWLKSTFCQSCLQVSDVENLSKKESWSPNYLCLKFEELQVIFEDKIPLSMWEHCVEWKLTQSCRTAFT